MKRIIATAAFLAMIAIGAPAMAQDTTNVAKKAWKGTKKGANKAWKGTKKVGKKVGNETAEAATKVKGKVTDEKSNEWVAPNGRDIYIDDGSKYYWIDEKGKRHFVSKDQLKAKK